MGGPEDDGNDKLENSDAPTEENGRTIGEIIGEQFSKAGEGISNAIHKTGDAMKDGAKKVGENIHKTGDAMIDGAKKVGDNVGKPVGWIFGGAGPGQKQKKNPARELQQKKFHKRFQPVPREEPKDTNIVGNITKLLPANTFLMFQTLAPLATNDGVCGQAEKFMTGLMLIILALTCMMVCFTDTFQFNGKVYHGVVTWGGLWNPSFKGDPAFMELRYYEFQLAKFYEDRRRYKQDKRDAIQDSLKVPDRPVEPVRPQGPLVMGSTYSSGNKQFCLKFTDFLHAILSAMAFGTLTLLTKPVSSCFYPNIPSTVVKTLPLLLGFVISAIFAFSPPARNGIAHPLPPRFQSGMPEWKPPDPMGLQHAPQLPPKPVPKGGGAKKDDKPKGGKKDDDDDDSIFDKIKHAAERFMGSNDGGQQQPQPNFGDLTALAKSVMPHQLQEKLSKEATLLAGAAATAAAQLGKDIQVAAANAPAVEAIVDMGQGLMNGGGSQALATATAYAQGAKDAVIQIHQDVQTAASPIAHLLQQQPSMSIARANAILQQAGTALAPLATHDANALFHQAPGTAQLSGLLSTVGSDAAAALLQQSAQALATSQALAQAGYNLQGSSVPSQQLSDHLLKQQAALTQGIINNHLQQASASALARDVGALVHQGSRSLMDAQAELVRQHSGLSQGLNAQWHTVYQPGSAMAQNMATLMHQGSQVLNGPHDQLALQAAMAAVAQGVGNVLLQGADHGMAGAAGEAARQKAALTQDLNKQMQSFMQPATSLAQNAVALAHQGSQAMSDVQAELNKGKSADVAAFVDQGSQSLKGLQDDILYKGLNSELVGPVARAQLQQGADQSIAQVQEQLARQQTTLAQYQSLHQPAGSVAIDVASLIQQGHQALNGQLTRQQSALYQPAMSAAQMLVSSLLQGGSQNGAQLQRQASLLAQHPLVQIQQSVAQYQPMQSTQQAVENQVRRLASLGSFAQREAPGLFQEASQFGHPSATLVTAQSLVGTTPIQQVTAFVQGAKPSEVQSFSRGLSNTNLTIDEVTDAVVSTQKNVEGVSNLTSRIETLPTAAEFQEGISNAVAHVAKVIPSTSQLVDLEKKAAVEIAGRTSQAVAKELERGGEAAVSGIHRGTSEIEEITNFASDDISSA